MTKFKEKFTDQDLCKLIQGDKLLVEVTVASVNPGRKKIVILDDDGGEQIYFNFNEVRAIVEHIIPDIRQGDIVAQTAEYCLKGGGVRVGTVVGVTSTKACVEFVDDDPKVFNKRDLLLRKVRSSNTNYTK